MATLPSRGKLCQRRNHQVSVFCQLCPRTHTNLFCTGRKAGAHLRRIYTENAGQARTTLGPGTRALLRQTAQGSYLLPDICVLQTHSVGEAAQQMAHKSLAQLLLALAVCTRDPPNFPTFRLFLQPGRATLTPYRGGGEWDGVGAESPNQQKDATASKGPTTLVSSSTAFLQNGAASSKGGPQLWCSLTFWEFPPAFCVEL